MQPGPGSRERGESPTSPRHSLDTVLGGSDARSEELENITYQFINILTYFVTTSYPLEINSVITDFFVRFGNFQWPSEQEKD